MTSIDRNIRPLATVILVAGALFATPVLSQETIMADIGAATLSEEELAKKLANPVAALISVPFQLNYDQNIGSARDGDRWTLNIQPVIPFDLSKNWNLISRTILPVIWQDDIFPGAGNQSGIGDVTQSLFFSPKAPTASGWIWGAGPAFLLPTGSDDLLSGVVSVGGGVRYWADGPDTGPHGWRFRLFVTLLFPK